MHVTLTRIAKVAGVSVSAVSYALRQDPRIAPATAARILQVAERLGYRPNPRVAALMSHIRGGRKVEEGERIGLIWMRTADIRRTNSYYEEIFASARRRAEQLGYGLEEFSLGTAGMTPARLAQILRSRGIAGILIAPLAGHQFRIQIDWNWNWFAPAVIGNALCEPELHHSGHHHAEGMRQAIDHLAGNGARRLSALLPESIDERAKRGWSASFCAHHPLRTQSASLLHLWDEDDGDKVAARWLRKTRSDFLLTTRELHHRFRAHLPPALKVALLDRTATNDLPGIDQGNETIAANAVDLVVNQLHSNERGAPQNVKMLLFPGKWCETGAA